MNNELEILKMYLTIKNEVETVIKSFKFNLNLINYNNINETKIKNLLISLELSAQALTKSIEILSHYFIK